MAKGKHWTWGKHLYSRYRTSMYIRDVHLCEWGRETAVTIQRRMWSYLQTICQKQVKVQHGHTSVHTCAVTMSGGQALAWCVHGSPVCWSSSVNTHLLTHQHNRFVTPVTPVSWGAVYEAGSFPSLTHGLFFLSFLSKISVCACAYTCNNNITCCYSNSWYDYTLAGPVLRQWAPTVSRCRVATIPGVGVCIDMSARGSVLPRSRR